MKKKIIFLILVSSVFLVIKIALFASDTELKEGYPLYEERVEEICDPYKPEKIIYSTNTNNYLNLEEEKEKPSFTSLDIFNEAKNLYKENMNNIYKCMIYNSQIKSLQLVKEDLMNNSPKLKTEIEKTINEKISELQKIFETLGCLNSNNDNDGIQKLALLKQTTYELCKYHSYLEYLREFNSDFTNLVLDDDDSYDTNYIVALEEERKNEIDDEIAHIYKVFPVAFDAYKQYEDKLTIHILLELVKEDYVVFREALHKSLNPINQVVYKISNAMNLD